jgi:hypothetical protein
LTTDSMKNNTSRLWSTSAHQQTVKPSREPVAQPCVSRLPQDRTAGVHQHASWRTDSCLRVLCMHPIYVSCRFTFDHVYDQDSTQNEVYDQTAKPLVLSTLQVRAHTLYCSLPRSPAGDSAMRQQCA